MQSTHTSLGDVFIAPAVRRIVIVIPIVIATKCWSMIGPHCIAQQIWLVHSSPDRSLFSEVRLCLSKHTRPQHSQGSINTSCLVLGTGLHAKFPPTRLCLLLHDITTHDKISHPFILCYANRKWSSTGTGGSSYLTAQWIVSLHTRPVCKNKG